MGFISKLFKKVINNSLEEEEKGSSNWKKHLKKGEKLIEENKYIKAVEELEKAYNINSTEVEVKNLMDRALFKIAEALIEKGEAPKAKEILLKYSHIENNDVTQSTLNNLSWVCNTTREFEEALEYSEKGLELDDTDHYLYSNKGNALIGLRRFEEGLEAFNTGAKHSPKDNTIILYGKGICLLRLEQYKEAEEAFREYLAIKDNEDAYDCLMESLVEQNKYKENIEFIDSILEKYYEDPWYHYKKGISLLCCSSYHAAIEAFDEALFLNPNYANAYYGKCRIYCRFRIFDGAFSMLEKAIGIDEEFKRIASEDSYLEDFVKFNQVRRLLEGVGEQVNG